MADLHVSDGRLEAIWVKAGRRPGRGAARPAESPPGDAGAVTLVAHRGIAGNADQGGRRQVAILAREAWERATAELGRAVDPSARRANLLVSGVPLQGTRGLVLAVGACRIRILGEVTPCERMDEACAGLQAALGPEWRGGVFGEVIEGGVIRVGDPAGLRVDAPDRAR